MSGGMDALPGGKEMQSCWDFDSGDTEAEKEAEKELAKSKSSCTFPAQLCKCLIINGAGEGNRTLVFITKVDSLGNPADCP
jgi:hypothetical protein